MTIRYMSFRSMLSAIAFVLQGDTDHYFTATEDRELSLRQAEALAEQEAAAGRSLSPEVVSTLAELAVDPVPATCVGIRVENSHYCGVILAHYRDNQEIVRFVAIRP